MLTSDMCCYYVIETDFLSFPTHPITLPGIAHIFSVLSICGVRWNLSVWICHVHLFRNRLVFFFFFLIFGGVGGRRAG